MRGTVGEVKKQKGNLSTFKGEIYPDFVGVKEGIK
jgi:hypothetical protein